MTWSMIYEKQSITNIDFINKFYIFFQYRWLFWIADILTDVIYATDMIIQMNISYIDDGIYVSSYYPTSN